MTNDTSIQRTQSTEPNDSIHRRKSNTEQLNLNQASFFDELLTLGKFETQFPATPSQAVSSNNITSSNGDVPVAQDPDQTDPKQSEKEESSNPDASSLAYAAQFASQNNSITPTAPDKSKEAPVTAICRALPTQKSSDENAPISDVAPRGLNDQAGLATESGVPDSTRVLPNALTTDAIGDSKVDSQSDNASSALDNFSQVQEKSPASVAPTSTKNSKRNPNSHPRSTEKSDGQVSEEKTEVAEKVDASAAGKLKKSLVADKNQQAGRDSGVDQAADSEKNSADEPRNRRAERLADRARSEDRADSSSEKTANEENANTNVAVPAPNANVKPIEAETTAFTISNSNAIDSTSQATTTAILPAFGGNVSSVGLSTSPIGGSTSSLASDKATSATAIASAAGTPGMTTASTSIGAAPPAPSNAASSLNSQQAARPNSGTSISPYQEVKLVQRVLRGIEQLGNGGGQVKLRLHPPELGSLQLSMRVESGQMFAKLEVESTAARDTLLSNVQTLKDRLADQGIKVQAFDVQLSADSSGSGTNGSNMQQKGDPHTNNPWENGNSRYAQRQSNRLSSDGTADRTPTQAWTRTNGSLDLTV